MTHQNTRKEAGQSIVLISFMLVGLVAGLGLAVDGGRAYAARRQGQNAADAASYAGAKAFLDGSNSGVVRAAIDRYALANRVASAGDVSPRWLKADATEVGPVIGGGGIPGSATGIRTTVTMRFLPYFLGVVIGGNPVEVRASSDVQTGKLKAAMHLMPVIIKDRVWDYTTEWQLFGSTTGSGNLQWISYDCGDKVENTVKYLNESVESGLWSVGQSVCGNSGVQAAEAIRSTLQNYWLSQPNPEDRYWILPIYGGDPVAGGSNLMYNIVSFGVFEFTGYDFHGSDKMIIGHFVKTTIPGYIEIGDCNTNGVDVCGISLN